MVRLVLASASQWWSEGLCDSGGDIRPLTHLTRFHAAPAFAAAFPQNKVASPDPAGVNAPFFLFGYLSFNLLNNRGKLDEKIFHRGNNRWNARFSSRMFSVSGPPA
jgi:hypothetical protein